MSIVSPHATHLLLRPSWWRAHLLQILPLLNFPRERQRAQELREIASQGGEGTIVRERLIERELRGEARLLEGRGVVPELLDEARDERELGDERVACAVALHLRRRQCFETAAAAQHACAATLEGQGDAPA